MSFGNNFTYAESPEKSITTQHQNEALLHLDCFDRYTLNSDNIYTGTVSNNNFLINHQKLNGFGELKKVAVTEYSFPWITPNVNQTNNTFFVELTTGPGSSQYDYIVIREDWYTPAELAFVMQTQLNTNLYTNYPTNTPDTIYNRGWAVTVNEKTNAFTISNTLHAFKLSYPDNAPATDLSTVIGIQYNNNTPFANTFTGGIPSMAYTNYVDVCSNALCKFQTLKDTLTQFNYTNIICRIYLQDAMNQPNTYFGSRPSVINRQITDPKYMKWNVDQMIGGIDISFRDDGGNLLYIPTISSDNPSNAPLFTLKLVEDN